MDRHTVVEGGQQGHRHDDDDDATPGASWEGEVTFDANCKKHATFKPGTPIAFSIEELLMPKGVTLDEQVADGAVCATLSRRAAPDGRTGAASARTSRCSSYDGFTDKTDHFRARSR